MFRIVRTDPSFLLYRILGEYHHRYLCLPKQEYLQYLCPRCSQIFYAKVAWLVSWCNWVKLLREDLWLHHPPCWDLSYKNLLFSNFDLIAFGKVRIQKWQSGCFQRYWRYDFLTSWEWFDWIEFVPEFYFSPTSKTKLTRFIYQFWFSILWCFYWWKAGWWMIQEGTCLSLFWIIFQLSSDFHGK